MLRQEGEELTFPLGSRLGPAHCTEPLFYDGFVREHRKAKAFLQGYSAACGILLIRGKIFTLIIFISVTRRNILMSVKISVSSLGCVLLLGAPAFSQATAHFFFSRSLVRVML